MTTETKKAGKSTKGKGPTPEECYNHFQILRSEQRMLIGKLQEIEMDLNEHKAVIDTLKDLDGDRKCYRLIGGVLCEKTVKDVLPTLKTNHQQLSTLTESLNEQVTKKGQEINDYKEKHNIRIAGQELIMNAPSEEEEAKDSADSANRKAIPINPVS